MELPCSHGTEVKGPMRRQMRKHKAAVAGTGTKVSDLGFDVRRTRAKKISLLVAQGTGLVYQSTSCYLSGSQCPVPRKMLMLVMCVSETHPEHKGRIWGTFQPC